MNAGMMQEQLKIEFPNVFALPGETEIKKFIPQLFWKSKKSSSNEDDNSRTYNNAGDNLINWIPTLREIVKNDPKKDTLVNIQWSHWYYDIQTNWLI